VASRLVVVVPSISDSFIHWTELVDRLKALPGYAEPDCQWALMRHGGSWTSRDSIETLAINIAARIDQRWAADGGYDDIVLVGHSLGGLIVRRAYLMALASAPGGRNSWAGSVRRIILFASVNRGVSTRFDRRWWLPLAAWLARVIPFARDLMIHDALRGSAFITNLRITWIREINKLDHPPNVVQFLGSKDRLITAEDSSDVSQFPTGRQQIIPDADHDNLIRFDVAPEPDQRFRLIATAFSEPWRTETIPEIGDQAKHVVIVLHGIRATNTTWVRDIAEEIRSRDNMVEVVTASYGRFSARKFAIPATRRRFIGWLEDTYAEHLAHNPKATFHFIGHSNGTYLLGHSLLNIPGMQFERVLLAGSVLPVDYDWRRMRENGQVHRIRNDRAARDIPVGILCAGLRSLGMRDVGTAGVDGFYRWDDRAKTEIYYHPGGHGAALAPDNLPRLVTFILDGDVLQPAGLSRTPSPGFSFLSRATPVFAWLLVALTAAVVASFVARGPWSWPTNLALAAAAILVAFLLIDLI
jgi:pimeloyl-ACP methyl ester carboxylesterase